MKTDKKKSSTLLIISLILLAVGIGLSIYTYKSSYQDSLATGSKISELKSLIADAAEGADVSSLQQELDSLSDQKLSQERPYGYSLTFLFFTILLLGKGIYNIHIKMKSEMGELSQTSMNISINNMHIHTATIHGTNGKWIANDYDFMIFHSVDNYLDFSFAQSGIDIDGITITKVSDF